MDPGKATRLLSKTDVLDQDVTQLAGIGDINAGKLRNDGHNTVRDVLTKFRGLGKSEDEVSKWLNSCGITNSEHKRDIYRCLKRIDDSN